MKEILDSVKETLIKTNPDYDTCDKKITFILWCEIGYFGIVRKRNLNYSISSICTTLYSTTTDLYQLETVPVPIVDKNTKANSYTELKIKKPYIALNTETYINIWHQELATCKRIGLWILLWGAVSSETQIHS